MEEKDVPFKVYESAQARADERFKKMWIIIIREEEGTAWDGTCKELGAASAVPFRVAFRVA